MACVVASRWGLSRLTPLTPLLQTASSCSGHVTNTVAAAATEASSSRQRGTSWRPGAEDGRRGKMSQEHDITRACRLDVFSVDAGAVREQRKRRKYKKEGSQTVRSGRYENRYKLVGEGGIDRDGVERIYTRCRGVCCRVPFAARYQACKPLEAAPSTLVRRLCR